MAIPLQPQDRDPARFNQAIRELVEGRNNAVGQFTLTPNATTTVVNHPNCSVDSEPQISPRTLNAAASLATTYISSIGQGSFVVTHASAPSVDRTFGYSCGGG